MRQFRTLLLIFMSLLFLAGLGVCLYPVINGSLVDMRIEKNAEEFLSLVEIDPYVPGPSESFVIPEGIPEPTAPDTHTELWEDMYAYNQQIHLENQKGLDGSAAYEHAEFKLSDYGLDSEIFGVITIPTMDLEMPIYIGASARHMADGTAILGQTSIPIGGNHTNAVIAGHRGWGGAKYFKEIDKLQVGDSVTITNLWEELHYTVSEIKIIMPNEVKEIHIQEGRELITLMSCHPFASGGRQRYLVICERNYETNINPT